MKEIPDTIQKSMPLWLPKPYGFLLCCYEFENLCLLKKPHFAL